MMKRIIALSGLLLLPSLVQAGGYMIPEQGTKAVGMGNAFAAVADDPSANWFNPAGIAFQDNGAMVSGDILLPTNKFSDATGAYTAEKKVFVVPQTYLNYRMDNSDVTFGFGVNAPFGLSMNWTNSGAPFSKVAAGSKSVTFSQIEAVHVNANVAYRMTNELSIAAGLAYYNVPKVHLDSQALKIGGHGDGIGGNIALMYKNEGLGIGLSYRSSVDVNVTGTAVSGPATAIFFPTPIAGNVTTSLRFPSILSAGIAYQWKDWLLSLQADRVDWTAFDKINLKFAPSALNVVTGSTQTINEGWKAVTAIRLGLQWSLDESNALRFGYVNDPSPTNSIDLSPRLPGNDRQLLTVGYGLDVAENMHIDFAYAYVWLKDRALTTAATPIYNGSYKSYIHIFSGGLVYRF